jgi:predicted metal-binding membrane protein
MSAALEAVLRRDRAIVIAALAIITILAWTDLVWLANDMWMDGMDMTGFRMIPAGQGWMMPASAPWQADRVRLRFWDVGRHDDRHDDAFRSTHKLIYARVGRQAATAGQPFAASAWFAAGYVLSWTAFSLAATSMQWVAGTRRAAYLNDGERQQYPWRPGAGRRRPLSVDAV